MKALITKYLNKESILYIIFGVATTVVDFAVFTLLHYALNINEIIANTIAWICAVVVAYITNKLFVFDSKSFSLKVLAHEIPSFVAARVFSLVITDVFLVFAKFIHLNMLIAKLLISVFVIVSNYVFSKLFIFKKKEEMSSGENTGTVSMADTSQKKTRSAFLPCLLAFIIPVVVLSVIFISRDVYPFGDSIYLRSDMYHQYAPFYKELYRKLTEGGSLSFSWNIGMGVNFTALYAYYLASPINLLLGFITIKGNILVTMDVLIILKTGLAGLTFAYYLTKHFKTTSFSTTAVSVFYALSSYMAAFSWNIMWLDCIILLPIIALGLENLVRKKKWLMYTLSLGLAIFTNYYIGIMLCIFSVLYFIVLIVAQKRNTVYSVCVKILHFIKASLLAGGLGAVMFIPAMCALSYTVSGQFAFPDEWKNYFSILDMISRSLMGVEVSILTAHEPNVYCTVAILLMLPLYCLCSKVNPKEKVGKIALIAILLLSFNLNIPNYIWHGFHFPNSLPCRESFIYIFLVLVMSYEALMNLKEFTGRQIYGCFFAVLGLIILIEKTYVNTSDYTFEIIYMTLAFLTLYLILIAMYRSSKINKSFVVYMFLVICISEAAISSNHEASYKPTNYSGYIKDNDAITNLLSSVDDGSFYRVEKQKRNTKNDAAWNDYKGVSIFSSTANGYFTNLLGKLGFEQSTNAYSYYGSTPLTSSMLSVKYLITNYEHSNPYKMELVKCDSINKRYLYELDYCLPLGYMIPNGSLDEFSMEGNDPFVSQNEFAYKTTGVENLFTRISATSTGTSTAIYTETDCDLYIYITNYIDSAYYSADNTEKDFHISGSESGLKHRRIIHIGEVPANTQINVSSTDTSATSLQLYAYTMDSEKFEQVYNTLNDEGLSISEYDDTHIKGTITANTSGTMLTSIVYDKGWSVYIDGKKADTGSFNTALLTVPVEKGTHTIEFVYRPVGFISGLTITILSIILILAIYILEKTLEKKRLQRLAGLFPQTEAQ